MRLTNEQNYNLKFNAMRIINNYRTAHRHSWVKVKTIACIISENGEIVMKLLQRSRAQILLSTSDRNSLQCKNPH